MIVVSVSPGADLQERVLVEVDRLQGRGVIRVLDVLFVSKNEDGTIQRVVVSGDEDLGALLAGVVSLDDSGFGELLGRDGGVGFDPVDARALAESLAPGAAVAFLLVEHSWAQPLLDVIAASGGAVLGDGFLCSAAASVVGAQVAAIDDAAEAIAAAQFAETHARLATIAAGVQAAEVVAASEAVRAAVAADTVRVLIAAGIVREAMAHEAIEAMSTAGLIVAAADEMAAEAVAEGVATVRAASITLAQARVLHYLPTKLSFAVIADKLGISRAAAKERAERAYKKLGVHSRADAVDRARELKLIK
jgi:DNA-binding NarL/FixJ family response regulator